MSGSWGEGLPFYPFQSWKPRLGFLLSGFSCWLLLSSVSLWSVLPGWKLGRGGVLGDVVSGDSGVQGHHLCICEILLGQLEVLVRAFCPR